ncbi:hypothetical protein ACFY2Y_16220 [Janibacter hoylei]|uniref:hypothetical protein n=1 Tax=Janibacter hoylei TaxID=364298 RepID=UPI0036AA8A63
MTDDETEGRKGLGLAAMLIGAVVVLGIILGGLALFSGNDDPEPTPSPTTSTPTAQSDSDSVCGLDGHEKSGTLNKAPDAEWRLIGTMAAPRVEKAGPGQLDEGGFGSCYARTREGALLAAANFVALSAVEEHQGKAYEQLVAPGPGRDRLIEAVKAGEVEQAPESDRFQIAGFRMNRYTDTDSTITLVIQSDGRHFSSDLELRWVDGDWKVLANDDGTTARGTQELPDLGGFIPWSGA